MAAAGGAPADAAVRERDEYEERVRFFSNFLHNNRDQWEKTITTELANNRHRIPLELSDVRAAEPGLDRRVLDQPVRYLLPWEDALLAFLRDINEKKAKTLTQPLKLDIGGSFGRNHVTPRGMNSGTLHQLMCVEGIVTKSSPTVPKLLQSMHVRKDKEDGYVDSRDHRDATAFVNQPNAGAMPSHDQDGNELTTEVGLSVYKDQQKFCIQETPENSPPGQIPRSVEVICEGDLAEKPKPGDRVQVIGVHRPIPPMMQETTNGVFPARIIATNITPIKEMLEAPFVTEDIKNIKKIAARSDAFSLLARSFAPSICGHEKVKSGLLLQMIGGTEKNLDNGTHLRGDINVLLVGDPSCGKSQMLRFVMNTAPLAISTTGRGSSGPGLTAAMTREAGARDFTLEAGAMVLADRGFICIDEFDKMSLNDRVAIHEAMEQQCVTIAKAGMHVTLNARCSVVAAANPIFGNFDTSKDLASNIGLPDSLLSRFDLVFIVRDLTTEDIDRKIASQVLRQAQYRAEGDSRRRGTEQIHSSILQRRQDVDAGRSREATEVFQATAPGPDGEAAPEIVTVDFLRKYLRFCRRYAPVLTEEARAAVADKYVDMRLRFQSGFDETRNPESNKKPRLAVTTRTLEALIRLATAHAKLKLRQEEVLPEDVEEAYKLMLSAREEDVAEVAAEEPAGGAPPPADDGSTQRSGASATQRRGRKRPREEAADEQDTHGIASIAPTRLTALSSLVARTFARQAREQISQDELLESVNGELAEGENPFSADELKAGLRKLESQNKVMVTDDGVVISVS